LLILTLALVPVLSCSEDPAAPEEDEGTDWPPMTDRDDVIETLVLTWNNPRDGESVSKYNALLHSLYFYRLHENDVNPGESPIMTRSEDIASTEWIFDVHTICELSVTATGAWYEYPELEGEPCSNCWETTRNYFVRVQFGDETTIYQSPPERAFVTIIVSPDESDPSKWVIRAIYDLGL
jgi:hypothetical protein